MPETPQSVKALIEKAYEEKARFLDLGKCGLTTIPEEINMLSAFLEALNLGINYNYGHGIKYLSSRNTGRENNLALVSEEFLIFDSFQNLKSLYLFRNQITDKGAEAIARLSNLTKLDIRKNQITDKGAEAIAQLSHLAYLDISGNQITDKGAEAIARLSNLTTLGISGNQITDKGAKRIAQLSNLTNLYIGANEITDKGVEAIAHLSHLTYLHIGENQITDDGAEAIGRLSHLTYLYISENQITDEGAGAIARLSHLTDLNIGGNQITDDGAEAIARLSNLANLNIHGNEITDKGAEAIARLSNLIGLDVSDNQIIELQTIRLFINKLESLSFIAFDKDKIEGLPKEIGENITALRGYFASTNKIPNTLVKMILIGNTTSGKSSLADFLVNKKYDPQRQSTHGIQLWRWKTSEDENALQVNIWDFGGQDYYHATHNLFLDDKTIFALLHTSKDIHSKNANEQQWLPVNYWLGNIRDITGTDCPVWFIASKADAGETKRPDTALLKMYNVTEEFSISVKQAYEGDRKAIRDFNFFSDNLFDELDKLKGVELPVSWVEIRNVYLPKWREVNKKLFFKKDTFKAECEHALGNDTFLLEDLKASWNGLLLYLKGCGEIIYFDDNAAISDIIFLSAEKLTKDIYETILKKDVLNNRGIINIDEMDVNNKESTQKYLEVLQSFGLIFKKPGSENLYVAPQYLPENRSEKIIRDIIPLAYIIHFSDYMSRSLITKFIVEYASKEPEENYWRYGAYFEKYGLKIFVKINAEEQKIYVHIQEGKKEYMQSLIKELFLFFTKIAHRKEKENDLIFSRKEELIKANTELSIDDVNYVRVQEIKLAITGGSSKVRATHGVYVDMNDVFSLLIDEGTIIPKKIFFSYAHEDEKYKEELYKHFSALERDKKIARWQDKKIKAGEDWDTTIKEVLSNADIVLLLLSSDFMASSYIWDVEIPKAKEKGVTIIPIFLRPCDFKESQFGIYKQQGLPGDTEWIVSNKFTYRDEAYLKVIEGIKKLL